ncbi:hypothetical protein Tco_0631936 [Tanacetum coccineum]
MKACRLKPVDSRRESVFNISGLCYRRTRFKIPPVHFQGTDVPTYTESFQELTLICTKFVANETKKIDKYISGLPDNIYGSVKSSRPKALDETIELANDFMDQKLCTCVERKTDNKRKADDSSRNNHGHQQQPFKRQNVANVYNMGTGEKKPYRGSLPKCTKCYFYHNGPCTQKCHKCNKVGDENEEVAYGAKTQTDLVVIHSRTRNLSLTEEERVTTDLMRSLACAKNLVLPKLKLSSATLPCSSNILYTASLQHRQFWLAIIIVDAYR